MAASPDGAWLLAHRPQFLGEAFTPAALAAAHPPPTGGAAATLGSAYAAYLCAHGFDPACRSRVALVADDDLAVCHSVAEILRGAGSDVTTVASGLEAELELPRGHYDLVLSDVVMPDVNGFEFTRQLQRTPRYANLPIFLCSSKSLMSDKLWGLRQGAKGYFTKPVNATDLLSQIQALQ
jgi:twitching motility two-component system response regulator PilH